ncbi:hypothetical protein CEXT_531001 [Caerostris extrusa]|uniref:Uncharacterized protein n=1 Tax=Caerostris extrusa TaxID=172846 RepID=A0AAV4RNX6_CAEEX|nr:hypothetical protein CEXT_531001 [Caerostris extrusa]
MLPKGAKSAPRWGRRVVPRSVKERRVVTGELNGMNGKKHRVWWDASGVSDRNMTSLYLAHILFLMGYLTAKAQESMTLSSSCCTLTTGSCRATCEEVGREFLFKLLKFSKEILSDIL